MPTFKTFKEAEKYGEKHFLKPIITETIHGSWTVWDQYDERDKVHKPNGR